MQPLKIYTAEELELKDFRYKYEDMVNCLNQNDFKALDRSILDFNSNEFLASLECTDYTLGAESYVIYEEDSYNEYIAHVYTVKDSKGDFFIITVFA